MAGVDISPVMVDMARRNVPEAIFVERDLADLEGLHPPAERFEAATASFSLLVLTRADIARTLDAIGAVLRPGAAFATGMVEGDTDFLLRDFLGSRVPLTAYPSPESAALLDAHGFTVAEQWTEPWHGPDGPAQTHIYSCCVRTGGR